MDQLQIAFLREDYFRYATSDQGLDAETLAQFVEKLSQKGPIVFVYLRLKGATQSNLPIRSFELLVHSSL